MPRHGLLCRRRRRRRRKKLVTAIQVDFSRPRIK